MPLSDLREAHAIVENPVHYKRFKHEPIAVIEALDLGPAFHIGNALKYVSRAAHKGSQVEDLGKAAWYLRRAVDTYKPKALKMVPAELDVVLHDWTLDPSLASAVRYIVDGRWTAALVMLESRIDALVESVRAATTLAESGK